MGLTVYHIVIVAILVVFSFFAVKNVRVGRLRNENTADGKY